MKRICTESGPCMSRDRANNEGPASQRRFDTPDSWSFVCATCYGFVCVSCQRTPVTEIFELCDACGKAAGHEQKIFDREGWL